MISLRALDTIDPAASSVENGDRIARVAIATLCDTDRVRLDFAGMRGGSSSLFNALLHDLRASLGVRAVRERVEFVFDTAAQRTIFERSRDAVLRESA